jgi:Fe-S oxidoreductase/nitrate reductase gamma subunit
MRLRGALAVFAASAPLTGAGPPSGWTSAQTAAFDFRTNGSALPLYGVGLLFAALFGVGVWRLARRLRKTGDTQPQTGGSADGGRTGGPHQAAPARVMPALARLLSFGLLQRRLLARPISAWIHLCIFFGFVALFLGSLTILAEMSASRLLGVGLSRGTAYAIFQGSLDAFGLVLIVGVCLALYRRLLSRPDYQRADPRMLAILVALLVIAVSGFGLEALRLRLEAAEPEPWSFAGSALASALGPWSGGAQSGARSYEILWWCHALLAFALIACLPFTPLRHSLTSLLQISSSPARASGTLSTPFELAALRVTGNFDIEVGMRGVGDLSSPERLGLAACSDSGRCQEVCPAYAAGTPLSPMRLMSGLREELMRAPLGDAQELPESVVTDDALWACTLCGACSRACPVLADPPDYVIGLRRARVQQGRLDAPKTELLGNLARAQNPYGQPHADRARLPQELGVRPLSEDADVEILYWIGCAATYDPRARRIAEATARIMKAGGVRFGVLGAEERCTGDAARRLGEEGLFQQLAQQNIECFERYGVRRIVTHCAHCYNTLRNEYPRFGAGIEVVHHAELIDQLIRGGRLELAGSSLGNVTLHDSCYVARHNESTAPPRAVLRAIDGLRLTEMQRCGKETFCCGGGSANYWYPAPGRETMGALRMREAAETGAAALVSECPYCLKMLEEAPQDAQSPERLQVLDIAEVVDAALVAPTSAA